MRQRTPLVAREAERRRLAAALEHAALGQGSLVLVAGDAGVGKTRLIDDLCEDTGARVLRGAARQGATAPYGPIVGALRSLLRAEPDALDGLGSLRGQLAALLPELGDAAKPADRATILEAIRAAFAHVATDGHALVVLDDLHWSDEATLELLTALAEPIEDLPVLVIAAYRSDGLPRDHSLRRLRHELRRAGRLDEVGLEPLTSAETGELAAALLGGAPSPSLTAAIHDRTQGVPFFVEELAAALAASGALAQGRRGLELAAHGDVPLPETVREAVLLAASELSETAAAAAELAAVAGETFDPAIVAELCDDAGLAELAQRGLVHEEPSGRAAFRHALTREALYADVPWLRRRALHRQLASRLEDAGADSMELARHWLGARDSERARAALLRAAEESEAVHAYRDAATAGRQALELWGDEEGETRIDALERYARCSELAGDLPEATRAWRELTALHAAADRGLAMADAQRRLAAAYELQGDRERGFAARRAAADAAAAHGRSADASVDHLAMANQLRLTGKYAEAVELAAVAREEGETAGRLDLRLRAAGLEGMARAKAGDYEEGRRMVQEALALALEHDLTVAAAELYQRLSIVLYETADYPSAADALDSALELCRTAGDSGIEGACVSCMAYVQRDRGQWGPATETCRELIASGSSVFVAEGLLGSIHAAQGKLSAARRLLNSSIAVSGRLAHYNMYVDSNLALARVSMAEGATDEAARHGRAILERWRATEDHHYAVSGLRWSAGLFAQSGDRAGANDCADALTKIASAAGHTEALAALACAIGEIALADGDPETAAEQMTRAVELQQGIDMPYERAQVELRAGVALAAAGEREPALERLSEAYRSARKLGARPLAATAAREVSELGESVVRRLGRRAAADADGGGLSRRELEVVRLLAVGRTNREIAGELFLSPRTVDMHVRNILGKLGVRSRVEAAHRAGEIGLLTQPS